MNFLKAILAFRRSRYFWALYIVVLSLIVAVILPLISVLGCLGVIMVPGIMFVIPYWLKERRMRVLAVNGLIVLILAATIASAMSAQSSMSGTPATLTGSAPPLSLTDGVVAPVRGSPGAAYNFTVTLMDSAGRAPSNFTVVLNLTVAKGLDFELRPVQMADVAPADLDLTDGKSYYANLTLQDQVYLYWFSVLYTNGTADRWFRTDLEVGPIVGGFGTFFAVSFTIFFVNLLIVVSFYYLILMLYWFTQRARVERQRLGMITPAETDTGFMCTSCGADVPADAEKCPKCGAVFEEDKESGSAATEPVKGEPAKEEAAGEETSEGPDEER